MRARAGNPFTLGVASGSPKNDSVVLWTRLAPDPLNGGGMGSVGDISISLEIATDFSFTNIIQSTQAVAEARYAHSVHHVVTGLQPSTYYYYRFSHQGYTAAGRTRTAGDGNRDDVKFAFVNCQNLQEGFYPVYRDIAEDDSLDLVVHLGDYIYDSAPASGGPRKHRTKARWTSRPSATGTRTTRWTRTSRPHTQRTPGSSPGTITRSRTTTRAVLPGTIRPPSHASGQVPTKLTMSTCLSRPTSRSPGP